MTANAMLDEALRHVARGWAVLPVGSDKEPARRLIRATRGSGRWAPLGLRPATADEVAAWFEADPATGIGVLTGEASGLVVVDVDDVNVAPELPATATVSTGRGGGAHHAYYRASEPTSTREFAWGEVRGDGAYVVAPCSRHGLGCLYRWQLSPEDVGELTDFADVELPRPSTPIRSTCLLRSYLSHSGAQGLIRLADLERDELLALRLGTALGLREGLRVGETFECLLHPDDRPSASLWRREPDAHVLYRDWHSGRHGEQRWLSLALVRARLAGREGRLAVPELTVWKLRLAAEAGLLEPVSLDAYEEPAAHRTVWDGFLDLLALRWTIEPGVPAPFSARFASAWCGVSRREAHEAVRELARSGRLRLVGLDPRGTRLWLPEGVRPPST
jgi:hypothetical protein